MKKVLWFSRHEMSADQSADLMRIFGSDIEVVQHSATINSPADIPDLMGYDVWAIVAPIGLQQQFKKMAGDRPVIFCKSKRVILEDGEKVQFVFDGWYAIKQIIVEEERL
jgi:hypothetical protein